MTEAERDLLIEIANGMSSIARCLMLEKNLGFFGHNANELSMVQQRIAFNVERVQGKATNDQ